MTFVQMRSTVAPVAAALRSGIESGRLAAPSPARLQQVRSALALFDRAASATATPAPLQSPVQALAAADRLLVGQLQSLSAKTASRPVPSAALAGALARWQAAMARAGTALSA